MRFPATRLRRLRRSEALRRLVGETDLTPDHLVQPLFVVAGESMAGPVEGMPGIERLTINGMVEEAKRARAAGVPAVLLFGVPSEKDASAASAYDDEGVVQLAVRALSDAVPDLAVITDVCLCSYTSHGHCGILDDSGAVDNDVTLELLAKVAISHAGAGADAVAPSSMMDGQVAAIRTQLDEVGGRDVAIISYSSKYASSFYGPFRGAAGSSPSHGDRRAYQLDPANGLEGVREAQLDAEEGADVVMVKPALPYLDVIRRIRDAVAVPLAAYSVSGEYAMIEAAGARGVLDVRAAVLESLSAMRRAGADVLITYHATKAAKWLGEGAERG